jgi:hypothetical protein
VLLASWDARGKQECRLGHALIEEGWRLPGDARGRRSACGGGPVPQGADGNAQNWANRVQLVGVGRSCGQWRSCGPGHPGLGPSRRPMFCVLKQLL